jgi:hypothetical protein
MIAYQVFGRARSPWSSHPAPSYVDRNWAIDRFRDRLAKVKAASLSATSAGCGDGSDA